jgi:hypothetical protein
VSLIRVPRTCRIIVSGLSAVGLALTLAACRSKPPHDASPTPGPSLHAPSASPSPSDPRLAAVQQALAAYRAMWDAYVAASNSGDPQSPALAQYATGSALQTMTKGLTANKSKGLTSKGSPQMDPHQTGFGPADAPTSVTIGDCLDDSHWLLYKANGELADNTPGGRRKVTAQVDKVSGEWKVTAFAVQGVGTC